MAFKSMDNERRHDPELAETRGSLIVGGSERRATAAHQLEHAFLMRYGGPATLYEACRDVVAAERAARHAAEAATRSRDDLFLTISHELRGPLNSILCWVELIRRGGLDDAAGARALATIERSAKLEARLVSDMIDVSRLVMDKVRLRLETVDLATVILEAVESVRPEADRHELHVATDLAGPCTRVFADRERLHQILGNLLSNAVKFTPCGGRVTVYLGVDGQQATIAVHDTGQGIAPELLPCVFDRFRQGDPAATCRSGLGLGLTIVRNLVELHGGTVTAESGGECPGATFTVRLPMGMASNETFGDAAGVNPPTRFGQPHPNAARNPAAEIDRVECAADRRSCAGTPAVRANEALSERLKIRA